MSGLYVPPTDESDHKKQNQSIQLIGGITSTNTDNITTNTSNIATNTANIATNTTGIATNTTNIAANTSSISALQTKTTAYEAAWTTYTPTITAFSGTFTSVAGAGAFLVIGKLVHLTVTITVTTVGTAATAMIMTLPTGTAKRAAIISGAETQNTGKAVKGSILTSGTSCQFAFYDNTFPGASSNVITLTGIYEQT